MNAPAISLLVPCFNAESYLPRLMESVRRQTRPFAEILCYDDGSSDRTAAVAESLGLRLLRGESNRGPAFARNRLREEAASPWLHFHDADDLLEPAFVERMSPALDDATDVAVCHMDWITESSRRLEIAWRYDPDLLVRDPVASNLANPAGMIACVFRGRALDRVGGFDESLPTWEDADLQVRLSHAGARYRVVPEVLSIGLRHERGASSDRRAMAECQWRLLERYTALLPARYGPLVAAQAERLGGRLLADRKHPDIAAGCLALCRRLNWPVPHTRNPALRLARAVLPAAWVLRWQVKHRDRAAARALASRKPPCA